MNPQIGSTRPETTREFGIEHLTYKLRTIASERVLVHSTSRDYLRAGDATLESIHGAEGGRSANRNRRLYMYIKSFHYFR